MPITMRAVLCVILLVPVFPASAQTVARLEADPARVTVAAGASAALVVRALDASGRVVDVPLRLTGPRQGVRVEDGRVTGLAAGEYQVVASLSDIHSGMWAVRMAPAERPVS